MGLPQIIIDLKYKASNFIRRSRRGIVVLILADDTDDTFTRKTYTNINEVESTDWTDANIDYIKLAFLGEPYLVICERIATSDSEEDDNELSDALDRLKATRFNYIAMPSASTTDTSAISTWIKGERTAKRTVKAVLANSTSNDVGIINFTTEGIIVGNKVYGTAEYTARLAGIFAGISIARSATYFVLDEVTAITSSATPDTDIDAGKLILIDDGEKIKIGRAVNSKTTLTDDETEDMKKIKIIEGLDMIRDDVSMTFADSYIGKVTNSYDNKVALCSAFNSYFKELVNEGVLYDAFDNSVSVDIESQISYLRTHGVDVDNLTDEEIKNYNTGSYVFIAGNIQLQDAMEDLKLTLNL